MAAIKVQVQMSKVQKYKSCTRYAVREDGANEAWETIDVKNESVEKLGRPEVVMITIEALSVQADSGA